MWIGSIFSLRVCQPMSEDKISMKFKFSLLSSSGLNTSKNSFDLALFVLISSFQNLHFQELLVTLAEKKNKDHPALDFLFVLLFQWPSWVRQSDHVCLVFVPMSFLNVKFSGWGGKEAEWAVVAVYNYPKKKY